MQVVQRNGRSFMIVNPAPFMLNSSLISDIVNRGDILAVDLETNELTAVTALGKPKMELSYQLICGEEITTYTSSSEMTKHARKRYDAGVRKFVCVVYNHQQPAGTLICEGIFQAFKVSVTKELERIRLAAANA